MLTPWRVRLLGDLRAERGAEVVSRFRSHATASLFAYLALHPGRSFGREELADKFWPDADPEAARNSLRVSLSALKKALEPPPSAPGSVIETTRTHLKLRAEAVQTDVSQFESAVRGKRFDDARALYAGPLLPGFYDDWALEEAARLEALAEGIPDSDAPHAPNNAPQPPGLGEKISGSPKPGGQGAEIGQGAPGGQGVTFAHNLPLTLTPFFGREEELGRLLHLLADDSARLVTLLGPGGVGKTRTALEAARTLKDGKFGARAQLAGGLWFVPVAALTDAGRLPDALRDAVGLPPSQSMESLEQLAEHFQDRPALAIFDNLEQLGGAAGAQIERILARLPRLSILATSRIRLGVPGERTLSLGPLPIPGEEEPLETLAARPAIALFCERARAASPEFGLTARNASSVAQLCAHLDGLPLALELAAAWAGAFTPTQMRERLSERLNLETRRPDREVRHQSLRAAIGWSVDLLPAELQKAFAALSVFPSAFAPEAASEVTGIERIHDALSRLREQSLLVTDSTGEAVRFGFLESLREFASELLSASPDEESVRARHAAWAVREADALRLTLADEGSVRVALAYLNSHNRRGDVMRLTGRYGFVWFRASLLKEGLRTLDVALALDGDDLDYADRLPVYRIRGAFCHYLQDAEGARQAAASCRELAEANGDTQTAATMTMDSAVSLLGDRRFGEAQERLEAVLRYLRTLDRPSDVTTCLQNIAICAIEEARFDVAETSLDEALQLAKTNTSKGVEFHVGQVLNLQARLARCRGEIEKTAALQEEAAAQLRADDHKFFLWFVLIDHAIVRALQGRFPEAFDVQRTCLELQRVIGSDEGWLDLADTTVVVRTLAGVATKDDARLLGATAALRAKLKTPRYSLEERDCQQALRCLEAKLGPTLARATKSGQSLSLEQLISEIRITCGK